MLMVEIVVWRLVGKADRAGQGRAGQRRARRPRGGRLPLNDVSRLVHAQGREVVDKGNGRVVSRMVGRDAGTNTDHKVGR
jgi:hypothetical protein